MINDVKVKIILGGDLVNRLKELEEFKKSHRVIKVIKNETVIIIKYSEGQINFDDLQEVDDGNSPW